MMKLHTIIHFLLNFQCRRSRTRAGDGRDNDCDGKIDEEILDGKDNDGDGRVDEDLQMVKKN